MPLSVRALLTLLTMTVFCLLQPVYGKTSKKAIRVVNGNRERAQSCGARPMISV